MNTHLTDSDAPDEWKAPQYIDLDVEKNRLRRTRFASNKTRKKAERHLDVRQYLTKQEFLTKQEAGDYVRLNVKTIERLIRRGEIPAFKLARRIRIRRSDLDSWVEESRVTPYAVPEIEP